MAITILQVTHGSTSDLPLSDSPGRRPFLQRLVNFFAGLNSGAKAWTTIERFTSGAKASGTFTLVSAVATDAITINGTTFTAVAGAAANNQWSIDGASDALDAAALAAAINASTTDIVNKHVVATVANNVVTVTAVAAGHSGNAITITSADATITASGARLTGGSGTYTSLSA